MYCQQSHWQQTDYIYLFVSDSHIKNISPLQLNREAVEMLEHKQTLQNWQDFVQNCVDL